MPKAVIMAGGQGERFWPMTHEKFPKYRIPFYGKKSLLQKTSDRLEKVYDKNNVYVITTQSHASMIRKDLPKLSRNNILIEPSRRNTAPAIYLASFLLAKRFGPEEVISFFPADQLIQDEKSFASTIQEAIQLAGSQGSLVTVGIRPTFPATGYGYIEKGLGVKGFKSTSQVRRFVEKPDAKTAATYLRQGKFFWNAGIFTWKIKTFLDAMHSHSPGIARAIDRGVTAKTYGRIPSISIDYALFEKAKNVCVVETSMDWCDVGNWDMFWAKNPLDPKGNYVDGISYHQQSTRTLLVNHTQVPLVALGLSDVIVVQTERGTLVCPRGRAEEAALFFKNKSQ